MNIIYVEPLSPRCIKSCTLITRLPLLKKGSGALGLPPYTVATPDILIMSKETDSIDNWFIILVVRSY